MTQATSSPALRGVAHFTLPVGDLQLAEQFYVELLGARLVQRFDRATFLRVAPQRAAEADADNSPLHLTITIGDSPQLDLFLQRGHTRRTPAPHPHLAFDVAGAELDAFHARLRAANVPCDGPRRLGPPGQASLYFADPWGQLLELVATDYAGATLLGPPDASRLGHAYS
jgi:catechol 2,3-dioxygenase-like lactoylglutathione lyase family enzyme